MEIRNHLGQTEKEFLENYKVGDYERPSNTVDIVLFRMENEEEKVIRKAPTTKMKILLIKRKDHPFIGQLALPGGFCNKNEDMEMSARRELLEETSVSNCYMEEIKSYSTPNRDPRTWVVSHSFLALLPPESAYTKAGDDAEESMWYEIRKTIDKNNNIIIELYNEENGDYVRATQKPIQVQNGKIMVKTHSKPQYETTLHCAFDHIEIIADALKRFEERIENVSFLEAFLPKEFTLQTMQNAMEGILGKSLVKQNFRKKVLPYLEDIGIKEQHNGYRPASLYHFKEREDQ